jgi:hypothetical protein
MRHKTPPGYKRKFARFIELCEKAKIIGVDEVLRVDPSFLGDLGDTYDEVMESFRRLAGAGFPFSKKTRRLLSRTNPQRHG